MIDTITLPVRSYRSTDRLDKIILDCSEQDLRFAIGAVFAREINEQKRLGNPPSNILVDGSGVKPLSAVRRRAQAHFVRLDDIRRAAEDALRLVELLTRYKTGRARASIAVWRNNTPVASVAEAVARFGPEDRVRIVGPSVPYGRKLHWNPTGAARFRRGVRRSIYDIAVRRLKSRHKGLYIAEDWVDTPELGRTPALAIGQRFRGRLNG